MLKATVATQSIVLTGCDTMRHADKFARFPFQGEGDGLQMSVWLHKEPPILDGVKLGEHGHTHWCALEDGRTALMHDKHHFALTFDEDFSNVSLLLSEQAPKRDVLKYLYVSQSFAYRMIAAGGCVLHAAGLRRGERGVALCGASGVGKSTLARHLQEVDKDIRLLCEDAPPIREQHGTLTVYGSPFCGDDEGCERGEAPLSGAILLRQGTQNRLSTLKAGETLYHWLSVIPRPVYHRALCEKATEYAIHLSQTVPMLCFENDGTVEAAAFLKQELERLQWL